LLGLPGALFYVTYNAIAYAAAMPLAWLSFGHLALAGLSAAAIFLLFSRLDGAAVQARLQGQMVKRFSAGILIGFGTLFFPRTVGEFSDVTAGMAEFGVLVADGLTTPLWILGGLYLWRRQPLGYASGAGLLVFFIAQPFVAGAPFPLVDFLVVLAMGLVVFVPFGLFLCGISKAMGEWRAS
jgi:hypothetical protein